ADFCLLVTRRRHRDDLALVARGAEADRWLGIAQAYRGPAGDGPKPLSA
ncbi:MAG: wyosine base formation domain-containing protein, partial [Actinomycetota bacterium]|nr:wyosine base formation domain-containing protein [Actinomycetota bacterium]